ncbi:toll/interleukin-1 receptor domain-containing protein [Pseudomonas faucium]|uniref:toll/interleukin-1 receptor domain-containing protein n=1 Tax=Pseudomonas faucium TaxID=2740518 RepID=UPI001F3E50E6|nr:toll/interleukin-1 receptor domain-containing protein [Pseudomonas faucium]
MYNLFMTAGEDDWNNPTWTIETGRFLEHTVTVLEERFRNLTPEAALHLKQIPALFAYESFRDQPARVGRVTEIQQLQNALRITLAIDPAVAPIPQAVLAALYPALDINTRRFEHCRTHWAVKDVDLVDVLTRASLLGLPQLPPQPIPPKVFVSYSWDSPEHRQWVAQLAGILRANGIDAILDQWHVRGGEDLAVFMERSIREADRVLVICTEGYFDRAMNRQGGVGYEHTMVTGELMRNVGTAKFIPIVRQSGPTALIPTELNTRLRFDLSAGVRYAAELEALIRDLHNVQTQMPPLGPNPYA